MKRLTVALTVGSLIALAFTAYQAAAQAPTAPMRFGMDANSITPQTNAGVKPEYGTFWVGPWTLKNGWGGPEGQMTALKNAGVTPAIHFYYWGDDISRSCIENGCWSTLHSAQKTKAGWQTLAEQLVDRLHARMAGAPVIIFLETEFNKGDVSTYEPMDGYLTEKANFIRAGYPQAKIVMALGNWNNAAWGTFDRTAAASDYTGIQGMRGSTRNSLSNYLSLYESTLVGAQKLQSLFGKPVFIQDIALSTYPEPEYLAHQSSALKKFFTGIGDLKAAGVVAMLYRTWQDNPNMNTANYYGTAERHWGFAFAYNGTRKPAAEVWIDGVKAERASGAPPAPSGVPVPATGASIEAETFATKTAGGLQTESQASGGRVWNLWGNGHIAQGLVFGAREYDLVVRARSTLLGGVGAHMEVSLNGARVLSAYPGTSLGDHVVRVATPDVADLRIAFLNDARSATEDRNLILDRVSFVPRSNDPPVARFTSAVNGLDVSFDASASTDAQGDPLSFTWAFGDGASGQGMLSTHRYAASGTYTVRLTVSDGQATSSSSASVTVVRPNTAPVAQMSVSAAGLQVTLDGSGSSDADGDALAYAWRLGDGATASGARVTHTYARAGTYTVTLDVSDGKASGTAQRSVTVAPPAFAPRFDVSPNVNAWWVEVKVTAENAVRGVDVQVNGGPWVSLSPTNWGTWAKSLPAPRGSTVVFQATDAYDQTARHEVSPWLGPKFTATFTPKTQSNRYWIEVGVTATAPVAKVEARTNAGPWFELAPTSWDTYAKSVKLVKGTNVEFRATSTGGDVAASGAYRWG